MNTTIRLSEKIAQQASIHAKAMNRSMAKQVEYWARMGKIAEENPELPFQFLKDILIGKIESEQRQLKPYPWEQ